MFYKVYSRVKDDTNGNGWGDEGTFQNLDMAREYCIEDKHTNVVFFQEEFEYKIVKVVEEFVEIV